ncbi:MAG: protein kinase [Anaerolineae bacterium]|nr:protein kinase [Anaerolineae bacterium]
MDPLIGQQLGQYEIITKIGVGGMATVYRAHQKSMDRSVAIKVIKQELATTADFVERFQREAKTVAKLSHPHILKVFDYGNQNDLVYIVMELLEGGSLSKLIVMNGALKPDITARILSQIGQALDYAHGQGIVHRDLKPENVLMDKSQNAFLTDFGIAKLINEAGATLTKTGAVMGTPAYMAPELWAGGIADARSDLYALGIVIYNMITGTLPFFGETPFRIMYMHINEQVPPPSSINPDVTSAVDAIIKKTLSKNPEQRFSSAGELVNAYLKATKNNAGLTLSVPPTPSSPSPVMESTRLPTRESQAGRSTAKDNDPDATAGKMPAANANSLEATELLGRQVTPGSNPSANKALPTRPASPTLASKKSNSGLLIMGIVAALIVIGVVGALIVSTLTTPPPLTAEEQTATIQSAFAATRVAGETTATVAAQTLIANQQAETGTAIALLPSDTLTPTTPPTATATPQPTEDLALIAAMTQTAQPTATSTATDTATFTPSFTSTLPPQITATSRCTNFIASFSLVNNGGPMMSPGVYEVHDSSGSVMKAASFQLGSAPPNNTLSIEVSPAYGMISLQVSGLVGVDQQPAQSVQCGQPTPTPSHTPQPSARPTETEDPVILAAATLAPLQTATANAANLQNTVSALLTKSAVDAKQTQAVQNTAEALRVQPTLTAVALSVQATQTALAIPPTVPPVRVITATLRPTAPPLVATPIIQCPGFMPSRLAVGMIARVTPGDPNRVRSTPDFGGQILGQIPGGQSFTVVAGPMCNNDTAWWKVNYNGLVGWTSEGQDFTYYLEPLGTTSQPIEPTLTADQCYEVLPSRLVVGGIGRVLPGFGDNALKTLPARHQSNPNSRDILGIPPGATFTILDGPVCDVEGFVWWRVRYSGKVGWTPEGSPMDGYWLEPVG